MFLIIIVFHDGESVTVEAETRKDAEQAIKQAHADGNVPGTRFVKLKTECDLGVVAVDSVASITWAEQTEVEE